MVNDEEVGRSKPSLNELYIKVEKVESGRQFWRLVAICGMVASSLLLITVVWLAFSLDARNSSINGRDCRDAEIAKRLDQIGEVINGAVNDDDAATERANRRLQELGSLEEAYRLCNEEN